MYSEINNLVNLSQKGDKEAKEALLNNLKPLIISSIRRYYNKKDIYDDLLQDGYETILLSIEEYDPDKGVHFLGYVKAMLKYCYLNKHRQKQVLSLNEDVGDGLELMDMLTGEDDPLGEIIEDEKFHELGNSLEYLTERQKNIVVGFYIKNKSISSIAEELGISYRTVVNIKTSAIKKLKEMIVK